MALEILPVYVSSTWLDLEPERKAVEKAVQRMRETKFVGMEYFGSRDETTRRASLDDVDRAAEGNARGIYVGIFAARYGSGITAEEYRKARERELPCFIYFKDDTTVPDHLRETVAAQTTKLNALKKELRLNHLIGPDFTSPDDLAAKVTADIHRWLFDEYVTPKLKGALRGEVESGEAQALLDAVKDLSALSRDLLTRLQGAGFSISIEGDYVGRDKITNIYNAPAAAVSALHQIPPPPRDFTGRERELDELMSQIERGGVTISGLQGQGGIGKTALALKLAQQLSPRYPDAQFYLDLKGASNQQPVSVAEALSHVIRAYHPTAKLPEGVEELRALYFSVLNGQRALVLMDNARDAAQVEPLVPPDTCVLLVTSRQHFTLPGLFPKRLDTLSPEESRELLLKIAPRIGERAGEIAKLCGYLPLALRLAASALAERENLSPADYVRRLSDAKTRLGLVEASLTLSYDLLSAEMQRLWRALSVFPDTFDAAAAAAIWETNADAALDALGDLLKFSMLDWDATTARYRLHDLARLFANSRQSETERSAGRMHHAEQYLKVLRECHMFYSKGGEGVKSGLALFDAERRNIEAGQEWAREYASVDEAAARLCHEYPYFGVYILNLRQHPRERILWLEAGLAAARQLKDRAAEGRHLVNLGSSYYTLGEYRRAIEFYEQQLVIARENGDQLGESYALSGLGVAHQELNEPNRAIEYHEQALSLNRKIGNRREEGENLTNLGISYMSLGELRRAIEFYEQCLIITREIGNRFGEGAALGNLGVAYYT
ncbi:MAG TPA: tetratricopeptide repeat protein, partial [Pyrinomonadaceae bacterium]|nr:tetratricopeptide repeat protein [Pyrinomonadaceae bacterium]